MTQGLAALVHQIRSDQRLASLDEAATKQVILLQVLSLLGWNVYDIDEVRPEYAVGAQRVDYSLRHSNANKVSVEVKKVGEDLDKHHEQLLSYSFKEGVHLAVLTNGISWRFYLPLHEGSWEQRRFLTIEILDQELDDVVNRFIVFLGKEGVCSGEAVQSAEALFRSRQKERLIETTLPVVWHKLLSEPHDSLIELVAESTEKACGYKPDISTVERFIAESVVGARPAAATAVEKKRAAATPAVAPATFIGTSVTSFSLRGERQEVRYWIDVLTKVCQLMLTRHSSTFENVLQLRGTRRPYFTMNPDELRIPAKIEGSEVFMESNLSSSLIVRISLRVLALFGYSEGDFRVEAQ